MKTNPTTTTLTAIVCLLGVSVSASARPLPQAISSVRTTPAPGQPRGTPLLVPVAQERFVDAGVYCFDSGYFGGGSVWAPDFGPFAASVGGSEDCGTAFSTQESEILEDGIVVAGDCSAWTWGNGVTWASSYASVRFSVTTPVSYHATGSNDGAVIELSDDFGVLFSTTDGTLDELGLLTPGEYVFSVDSAYYYGLFDVALDLAPCDTTPPRLLSPSIVHVVDQKGSRPGEVAFFSVTADDGCDPSPSVVCVPPSGSFFPRGTTMVSCTATDASGNQSTCTFPVVVQPTVRENRL